MKAPPAGLSLITRSPSGVFKIMAPIPVIPVVAGAAAVCSCRAAEADPACRAEDAASGVGALGEDFICISNARRMQRTIFFTRGRERLQSWDAGAKSERSAFAATRQQHLPLQNVPAALHGVSVACSNLQWGGGPGGPCVNISRNWHPGSLLSTIPKF